MTFREELELILSKELESIEKLEQIAIDKTDIIVENKVEDLEKLTKLEEALINQIGQLEETRQNLLDTWGLSINISIDEIIEKLPEDTSNLINLKNQIKDSMIKLSERNKINSSLIQENLDWIDFNMNLMTSTHVDPGYGKENIKTSKNSLFDRKV